MSTGTIIRNKIEKIKHVIMAISLTLAGAFGWSGNALAVDLTSTSSCPGPVQFSISAASTNQNVVVFRGDTAGSDLVGAGPCVGTVTGLTAGIPNGVGTTDALGEVTIDVGVPPFRCDDAWQALDLNTCTVSDVFYLGSADGDGDGLVGSDDCDDTDPAIGAKVDAHRDQDGDGYGRPMVAFQACALPSGFVDNGDDCRDNNAAINPGAPEILDGMDNDCDGIINEETIAYDDDGDGLSEVMGDCDDTDPTITAASPVYRDQDGDGYGRPISSFDACSVPSGFADNGDDCRDNVAAINPGAYDIEDDGIDQDCDGVDATSGGDPYLTVADLLPGDLVITEVMQNPSAASDSEGEWFEVYNASGMDIDLNDLQIGDDDNWSATSVVGSLIVSAGQYIVFAEEGDFAVNGGVVADYDYSSGFTLGNSSDEIILSVGKVLIDEIAYDNGAVFPDPTGASMSLDASSTDEFLNDDGGNWCEGVDVYGDGDFGTPGAENPACASEPAPVDSDLDGYTEDEDCDDTDASIYPGAPEIADDGIDQDCDGVDEETAPVDSDLDGYTEDEDCDDTDASIYPGAPEIADDGIDQDCDGVDEETVVDWLTVADLLPGDLVITEVMQNPSAASDSDGEWFEVYNASGMDIDLNDLQIGDDDNWATTSVVGSTIVSAGQYIVFAEEGDFAVNGGVVADYDYSSSFALGNSSDELILSVGKVVIDEIAYDNGATFPDPSGASMSLDPSSTDELLNDDGGNWCEGVDVYGDGDFGTPGAENPACASEPAPVDSDLDGYTEDEDCDDTDASIYPGAPEIADDGIDQDCDGVDEETAPVDSDLDGYTEDEDCDDTDASIYPGAPEIADDGIDQDCDGVDEETVIDWLTVADLLPGDLVITEVMQNPSAASDSDGEWFEVYNASGMDIDLNDLQIGDDDNWSHTSVVGSTIVSAGQYIVFAEEGDFAVNGGVVADYDYSSSFALGNSSDELILSVGKVVIDEIAYDNGATFPDPSGASMSLDPSSTDELLNDDGGNWCEGVDVYGDGDLGTPGAENPACASEPAPVDSDLDGYTEDEDCDDTDASIYPGAPEIADDGIDQDCDGVDEETVASYLTVDELVVGDLVITEVMQNPSAVSDSYGEWFEVYNASGMDIDLNDLQIGDDDNWSHTSVVGSLIVAAGQYIVFAEDGDDTVNGGVVADYDYSSSFALGNSSDELILSVGDFVLDSIAYDNGSTFPDPNGASMSLSGDAVDAALNDDGANWCEAVDIFGTGDAGTPGSANPVCE